jgi:hypothetical protein
MVDKNVSERGQGLLQLQICSKESVSLDVMIKTSAKYFKD